MKTTYVVYELSLKPPVARGEYDTLAAAVEAAGNKRWFIVEKIEDDRSIQREVVARSKDGPLGSSYRQPGKTSKLQRARERMAQGESK